MHISSILGLGPGVEMDGLGKYVTTTCESECVG